MRPELAQFSLFSLLITLESELLLLFIPTRVNYFTEFIWENLYFQCQKPYRGIYAIIQMLVADKLGRTFLIFHFLCYKIFENMLSAEMALGGWGRWMKRRLRMIRSFAQWDSEDSQRGSPPQYIWPLVDEIADLPSNWKAFTEFWEDLYKDKKWCIEWQTKREHHKKKHGRWYLRNDGSLRFFFY